MPQNTQQPLLQYTPENETPGETATKKITWALESRRLSSEPNLHFWEVPSIHDFHGVKSWTTHPFHPFHPVLPLRGRRRNHGGRDRCGDGLRRRCCNWHGHQWWLLSSSCVKSLAAGGICWRKVAPMSRDLYSSTFDQKNEQKLGEIYHTWVILVKFYICIYV